MSKPALITGAGGFIGRALVRELAPDTPVIAIALGERDRELLARYCPASGVTVVTGDLTRPDELAAAIRDLPAAREGVGTVYHLAWRGLVSSAYRDLDLQASNIPLSLGAAKIALALRAEKFVFVGTHQEYEVAPCKADGSIQPYGYYGAAKRAARILLHGALRDEMAFNATTFFHVFGEGDFSGRTSNIFIGKLLRGEPLSLVPGNNLYDWIYVSDAARGLRAVGEQGQNGKQYHIGNPTPRPFREIITELRDILCPSADLLFGAYPDPGNYTDLSQLDFEALHADTGYSPALSFREAVLRAADWARSRTAKE